MSKPDLDFHDSLLDSLAVCTNTIANFIITRSRESIFVIYRLIGLTGALKGNRITVDSDSMIIGRDPGCAICIQDNDVAAKHAVLEIKSVTGLHIRDLGSLNKVLVNNREVKNVRLKHGDIIEIGRTRFLLQASVEADVSENSARVRRMQFSLTPVFILLPLLIVIYAIVSFCHKIMNEGTRTVTPVVIKQGPSSNAVPAQVSPAAKPDGKKPVVAAVATENLTPISEEIRQMRQDIVGIRETVKELAVKPVSPSNVADNGKQALPSAINQTAGTTAQAQHAPIQTVANTNEPNIRPVRLPDGADTPNVGIAYIELRKWQENDDYDEMRVLTIGLQRDLPSTIETEDSVRVEVSFFDQADDGSSIVPTHAVVPTKQLKPSEWLQGTQAVITATYVIPKGTRKRPAPGQPAEQYYGYVVRVFDNGKLQAEDAKPKNLLHYSAGSFRKQDYSAVSTNSVPDKP
jgi:hypothetical protein